MRQHQTFPCFGARCGVWAPDAAAVADARRQLEDWHSRFSRFKADSELSRLNADPRARVPVSATMAALLRAVREAAEATGGLVDGTLLGEIERAGYRTDIAAPLPLALALRLAPKRRPAAPNPDTRPRELVIDGWEVTRPPGLAFDSGGLAKGLFADLIAERLGGGRSFAVDCGGDLRFAGPKRRVAVADPFGGPPLHAFELAESAVATSGIGRRSWLGPDGRPAHHLLDPSTGKPAFTGVVQATALAPTALEAEWRAKAAVLSGPEAAGDWLPHGGVVVRDDGSHFLIPTKETTMIKQTYRRIAVLASTAALAGGALVACGSESTTTTANAPGGQQQQGGQPPQGGGMDFSALAEKLGVSTEKLEAAMEKNRPQQGGSPDDMAETLAKALGLSTAKVQAALEESMPQGGGPPQGEQAQPQDATNS